MSSDTPLPSSFDDNHEFYEESRWQKLKRRLIEEPLIPLGCGLTCMALFGATNSIRSGDHNRANAMFRRRIYAQGFTLLAMLAGSIYWKADRDKRKEFEGVVAEKKKLEKRDAWLRELELRDEEDREVKARLNKRMERVTEREKEALARANAESKALLEKAEEKSKEASSKDYEAKSVLEESESRGILAAVQSLGWKR